MMLSPLVAMVSLATTAMTKPASEICQIPRTAFRASGLVCVDGNIKQIAAIVTANQISFEMDFPTINM